uniref:Uncharacterized protein n=1 Tax=Cucumis melo TaxID=3656 RepID=A0A9I9ELS6_CUCME
MDAQLKMSTSRAGTRTRLCLLSHSPSLQISLRETRQRLRWDGKIFLAFRVGWGIGASSTLNCHWRKINPRSLPHSPCNQRFPPHLGWVLTRPWFCGLNGHLYAQHWNIRRRLRPIVSTQAQSSVAFFPSHLSLLAKLRLPLSRSSSIVCKAPVAIVFSQISRLSLWLPRLHHRSFPVCCLTKPNHRRHVFQDVHQTRVDRLPSLTACVELPPKSSRPRASIFCNHLSQCLVWKLNSWILRRICLEFDSPFAWCLRSKYSLD